MPTDSVLKRIEIQEFNEITLYMYVRVMMCDQFHQLAQITSHVVNSHYFTF